MFLRLMTAVGSRNRPPTVTDFEMRRSGGQWNSDPQLIIVQQRREPEGLRTEATTPWLKEHLENAIAQHEQIAAEIERASEPDVDAVSSQDETSSLSSETPGR